MPHESLTTKIVMTLLVHLVVKVELSMRKFFISCLDSHFIHVWVYFVLPIYARLYYMTFTIKL